MDRRIFLKTLGVVGGSVVAARTINAAQSTETGTFMGVLVDETRCIGCRMCEMACAEAHGLPAPDFSDDKIFEKQRKTTELQLTVINQYKTEKGELFAKKQCMHCAQPACATACLTRAMYKTKEGPVIWRESKCMGCRYCMIACPFDVPKFEYNKAIPKIRKCDLCWDRLQEGKQPACVEICPAEVMLFGKRSDLLETARTRIYGEPGKYVHSIYGEHEAGGTGWLYLSAVPFEQLAFKTNLGTTPYPEYTKQFIYSDPIVYLLWPAMLLALHRATKSE
jgi:formate dehydrogenase iron-sulfur subunit